MKNKREVIYFGLSRLLDDKELSLEESSHIDDIRALYAPIEPKAGQYQNQDFLDELEVLTSELGSRLNEGVCIHEAEIKRIKFLIGQMGDIAHSFTGVQLKKGPL